jgi:hypothetical protein
MIAASGLVIAAIGGFAGATPALAATCTTSAQFGTCTYSPYVINNNMWGEVSASSQTLTATDYNDWSVTGSEPNTSGVKTYPENTENFPNPPLSSLQTINQDFGVTATPACNTNDNTSWEVAADDWLNGLPGSQNPIEIMVWEDNCHQYPAGSPVPGDTLTIGGQTFQLYAKTGTNPTYSLVSTSTVTSGTINTAAIFKWLEGLGYITSSDQLSQLDMGTEIVSTNGNNDTWTFDESANEVYGSVQHQGSGYCLDNTGNKTTPGNPVQLYHCLGDASQQWSVETWQIPGGGTYQMLGNPAGNCLAVPTDQHDGDQMVIEPCDATGEPYDNYQYLQVNASGSYYELYFPHTGDTGFCADDTGDVNSNGNKIQIYSCKGNASQQWAPASLPA